MDYSTIQGNRIDPIEQVRVGYWNYVLISNL